MKIRNGVEVNMINNIEKMFRIPHKDNDMICPYCDKHPNSINEYIYHANSEGLTPVQFVKEYEGTYCKYTGCFTCSNCYVKIGHPTLDKLFGAYIYYRMEVESIEGQNNNELINYRLGL